MSSLSRILVLLDGTEPEQPAVRLASRLAGAQDCAVDLTLLLVIDPPREAWLPTGADTAPAVDLAEREANEKLSLIARGVRNAYACPAVLVGGRAAEVAGWLTGHPIDLAVYAPRPSNLLRRLFAPDRVEAALRRAGVPLAVAPAAEREAHAGSLVASAVAEAERLLRQRPSRRTTS